MILIGCRVALLFNFGRLLTDIYALPGEIDSSDEKEIALILQKCQSNLEIVRTFLSSSLLGVF